MQSSKSVDLKVRNMCRNPKGVVEGFGTDPLSVNRIRASIGATILTTRRKLNLAQNELARRVGISNGLLSKIERGIYTPTLDVLVALAQKLELPLSSLFADLDSRTPCQLVKRDDGMPVVCEGSPHNFEHYLQGHTFSDRGSSELYLVKSEGDGTPFFYVQSGFVFLHMLSGEMQYRHGDRTFKLSSGDTLYFDASCLNGPSSITTFPVAYLLWRQSDSKLQRVHRGR